MHAVDTAPAVQAAASAKLAAEALATAVGSSPASVFLTLVAKNVHGKASNVAILGPPQAPAAGAHAVPSPFLLPLVA